MRQKAVLLVVAFVVGLVLGLAIAIALELFKIGGFFLTIGLIFFFLKNAKRVRRDLRSFCRGHK